MKGGSRGDDEFIRRKLRRESLAQLFVRVTKFPDTAIVAKAD